MVLSKLLALLKRKQRKPPIHTATSATPEFIIVPPPEGSTQVEPSICEEVAEQTNDECEEPVPLEEFHAVDLEVARRRAAEKGLFVLFKEYERWDLFNRRKVYWSITPSLALKLLRLETDMKSQEEFTIEEQAILKDLVLKRWVKILKNGGTYYYGLSHRTVIILQKQMGTARHQTF